MRRRHTFTVTGASSPFTTSIPLHGRLEQIHIDYGVGTLATDDVTIASAETPATTLLSIVNNNTDGWWSPTRSIHDSNGAVVDGIRGYFHMGYKVVVTYAGAGTITITIDWDE